MPPKKRVIRRKVSAYEESQAKAQTDMEEPTTIPENQEATGRVEDLEAGETEAMELQETQAAQARSDSDSDRSGYEVRPTKRGKRTPVIFTDEEEMLIVEFLRDNELIYNKCLMDYKDPHKRETLWDEFCGRIGLDKDSCKKWFQSQRTVYGKITHMKSGQGAPHLTTRQTWVKDNFGFLHTHIVRHLAVKSAFKTPAEATVSVPPSQSSQPPRMEPVVVEAHPGPSSTSSPRTSLEEPETEPPRRISLESPTPSQTPSTRHCPTPSSVQDAEYIAQIAERRKKFDQWEVRLDQMLTEKPQVDPRSSYCDWLRSEMTQLSNDSFEEFQTETFALLRLRRKDKSAQQQILHQAKVTTLGPTATFTQPPVMSHQLQQQPSQHQVQPPPPTQRSTQHAMPQAVAQPAQQQPIQRTVHVPQTLHQLQPVSHQQQQPQTSRLNPTHPGRSSSPVPIYPSLMSPALINPPSVASVGSESSFSSFLRALPSQDLSFDSMNTPQMLGPETPRDPTTTDDQ